MKKLWISFGQGRYPVFIGGGIYNKLSDLVLERLSGRRILVVTDDHVGKIYGTKIVRRFSAVGFSTSIQSLPPGERSKSWSRLGGLLTALREAGINRDDCLIALGGGVVGDIGGLAAGLYQRGIRWIYLPTSLLAQVDASIGGKVAVNLAGKNMAGMFYPPSAVVSDWEVLATLPDRHYRAGMAEVIKSAVVGDAGLFSLLEEMGREGVRGEKALEEEVITRSCLVKKRIVERDERERHLRMALNLGHTLGHALEAGTGYRRYLHGEAVAAGMVYAAEVAERMGMAGPEVKARLQRLLSTWSLPSVWPAGSVRLLLEFMGRDKKVRKEGLVMALPVRIGRVRLVPVLLPVLKSTLS